MVVQIMSIEILVYDRNHYFGLGLIPKPKLADTVTDNETTFQKKILVKYL